jgi:hypothetical protein
MRVLMGLIAGVALATAARAETLVQTDFTSAAAADAIRAAWVFNGVAALAEVTGETPVLRLTQGEFAVAGSAWHQQTFSSLSSFQVQFDVRFRRQTAEGNPAPGDGMAFAFANVPTTFLGDAGGALGLYGGDTIPEGSVFGLDINNYAVEGLSLITSGTREFREERPGWIEMPAGHSLSDGGVWRFTVRVTPAGANSRAEVFLEGGTTKLERTKLIDFTSEKPVVPATGRFGFAAATGGATQFTDVLNLAVVAPAP